MPEAPTFADVRRALRVVRRHLPETPLVRSPRLSGLVGADVFLKLDSLAPLGSFKARGVLNRLSSLDPKAIRRGLWTASTGNHGIAVSWAAATFGGRATVVVPRSVPRFKRDLIRGAGGRVVVAGANWNESVAIARNRADRARAVVIEDGDDRLLMAGAGTMIMEALGRAPEIQQVLAPVGGGNLIAGTGIAMKGLRSRAALVGVQSASARGTYDSWTRGRMVSRSVDTMAGGIATSGPAELGFRVMQRVVDHLVLVSETEILQGIRDLAVHDGVVAEGAAAAPAAALRRHRRRLQGRRTVLLVTGRTLDAATLRRALNV